MKIESNGNVDLKMVGVFSIYFDTSEPWLMDIYFLYGILAYARMWLVIST